MQCSYLKRSPHPTSPRGGEESPLPASPRGGEESPHPTSPRGGEGKTIEDAMKGEEISKKL